MVATLPVASDSLSIHHSLWERLEACMSKASISALSGVVVSVLSVLVARGVLGGQTADDVQSIALAVIAFGATVGIRSARK